MIRNGALTIAFAVLFAELAVLLRQASDRLIDFIPFIQVIQSGRFYISAYDTFFVMVVVVFRIVYRYNGINLSVLKHGFQVMGSNRKPQDLAAYIGAGIAAHIIATAFLMRMFAEPLAALSESPDAIRRIAMISLFSLMWLATGFLSKRASSGSHSLPTPPMPTNFQGMQMPPPP